MTTDGTGQSQYWRGVGDERQSLAAHLFKDADPDWLWQILLEGVKRHEAEVMQQQLAKAIEKYGADSRG